MRQVLVSSFEFHERHYIPHFTAASFMCKHFVFLLQNQKLHIENRLLREKTSGLVAENEELRQRLCLDTLDSKEKVRLFEADAWIRHGVMVI